MTTLALFILSWKES